MCFFWGTCGVLFETYHRPPTLCPGPTPNGLFEPIIGGGGIFRRKISLNFPFHHGAQGPIMVWGIKSGMVLKTFQRKCAQGAEPTWTHLTQRVWEFSSKPSLNCMFSPSDKMHTDQEQSTEPPEASERHQCHQSHPGGLHAHVHDVVSDDEVEHEVLFFFILWTDTGILLPHRGPMRKWRSPKSRTSSAWMMKSSLCNTSGLATFEASSSIAWQIASHCLFIGTLFTSLLPSFYEKGVAISPAKAWQCKISPLFLKKTPD